jgi:arginine deiminase
MAPSDSTQAPVNVDGEIGPLREVVITPPGLEFQRMVPSNIERHALDAQGQLAPNPEDLLFDDLVHLPALREQHQVLERVLAAATGPAGVVSTRALLAQCMDTPGGRSEAIEAACRFERDVWKVATGRIDEVARGLESLSGDSLAEALITGASHEGQSLLQWPLPNFLFARDLAAVVGDAMLLTYAAKPARLRGMALARTIVRHHPRFVGVDLIDIRADDPHDARLCIEGGDVQVVDHETVLVGASERTTPEAIERLALALFERGFERVLKLDMPKWHGAMHLDTLFTRIDQGHVLLFPPMVLEPETLGLDVTAITQDGTTGLGPNVVEALKAVGTEVEPVFCGGDDPVAQQREQWSDGANAFALEPGVFVTYRRNQATLQALERAGFPSLAAEVFLESPEDTLGGRAKAAIHLDGHELVRGRGGPRCLTMPVLRS